MMWCEFDDDDTMVICGILCSVYLGAERIMITVLSLLRELCSSDPMLRCKGLAISISSMLRTYYYSRTYLHGAIGLLFYVVMCYV